MTRWIITVDSDSPEGDSKVLDLMKKAAKLGLRYAVSSKETRSVIDVTGPKDNIKVHPQRSGGTI